jgi:hypothetical protein
VRLQGNNSELVAAWNFLLDMKPGGYFELMLSSDDIDVRLEHFAALAPVPAIPSVILTVTQEA